MYTDLSSFLPLLCGFREVFTAPSFITFTHLFSATLLNTGRQTVCGGLRFLPNVAMKNYTSYNRFFSKNKWLTTDIYKIAMKLVLSLLPKDQEIILIVDENIIRRKGRKVHGKGTYRDPIRSMPKHIAYCFGLQWLVISVQVKIQGIKRPWALPVHLTLLLPRKGNKNEAVKPVDATITALELITKWFPDRRFMLIGDTHYAAHRLAVFISSQKNLNLISHFYKDAALYGPKPPATGKRGAPRKKGERLKTPRQEAKSKDAKWETATIPWYNDKTKKVHLLSGNGLWYRSGKATVRVYWVFVRLDENGHEETFFSVKPNLNPVQIVSDYIYRWSIEVSFEEAKRHLHIETTENWSQNAIERQIPFIYITFTLVVVIFAKSLEQETVQIEKTPWYNKTEITYVDVIAHVRKKLLRNLIYRDPILNSKDHKKTCEIIEILIRLSAIAA